MAGTSQPRTFGQSHAVTAVRNPLTLLAVFSGLAEVAATVALTRIPLIIQQVYVWFVVGFPTALVLLFFIVLWFRPENLYAPGDYRKDPDHLMPTRRASLVDKQPKKKKTPRNQNQPMATS